MENDAWRASTQRRRGRLAWAHMSGVTDSPNEMLLAARAVGLRYVDPTEPGIARRRAGSGFSYRDEDGKRGHRQGDAGTHPGAGHPAGMDRCLDLPLIARPHPGNRPRRARSPPISISRSMAADARRNEVRAHDRLRQGTSAPAPRGRPRPATPRSAAREGPRRHRPAARDDADPGWQRGVRARQPFVRPDHVAQPPRAGHELRAQAHLPRQGRQGARRRPPGQAPGTRREVDPGAARPEAVPVRGRRRRAQAVDSDDVNEYLRAAMGDDFSAKDFRTWAGTVLAARALRELESAIRQSQPTPALGRAVAEVAAAAGQHAGSLPALLHPPADRRRVPRRKPGRKGRRGPAAAAPGRHLAPAG